MVTGKQRFRSLVDTGAEVCLMCRDVYNKLNNPPKLTKKTVDLQGVDGSKLKIIGCSEIAFKMGGLEIKHPFYVVENINRNVILGRDWLVKNGVRLYYDLGCIRIGKTCISLDEDIHVSSIVRLTKKVVVRPHTQTVCYVTAKAWSYHLKGSSYQLSPNQRGFMASQPGLMIGNSIGKLSNRRLLPVMIINSTNKTYCLRKGYSIGRIEPATNRDVVNVAAVMPDAQEKSPTKINYQSELNVSPEHKTVIEQLVEENLDIFASSDLELGRTETVSMKIDTGDHPPIRLRPYRTPLNKRAVVDKVIDEMLDAKLIHRSRSPWSFPVVIVDKEKTVQNDSV
ncbi:uncharacterized protein LOC121379631 [Gigantopelta aegis]|uniref:uncharacterized protein LOC121379631 n=1 Tax=Gigantopelta aegis TaxID=1735272 RepID=UPI001B88BA35|nr:uncharacterized protein LOC121379631 [Gigantopelta aegis]